MFDLAGSKGIQNAGNTTRTTLMHRVLNQSVPTANPTVAEGEEDDDEGTEELANLVEQYHKNNNPQNPFLRYLDSIDAENEANISSSSSATTTINHGSNLSTNASNVGSSSSSAPSGGTETYFDVDNVVTCWSDYLKAQYHAKSLLGIGGRNATGDYYGTSDANILSSGTASFAPFSFGSQFSSESLYDAARCLLEETDNLQGIQTIVDIDSGFGGLANDYLNYLREECPRTSIIVLGALQPHSRKGIIRSSGTNNEENIFNYSEKDRESIRNINLGLAYASFGSNHNDIDSVFIPLSLQSYAEAVDAAAETAAHNTHNTTKAFQSIDAQNLSLWFPGIHRPVSHKHFQTSALLATAWDTLSMPYRRNQSFQDNLLPVSSYHGDRLQDISSTDMNETGLSSYHQQGLRETLDTRIRHTNNYGSSSNLNDNHLSYDPSIEMSADAPMIGLNSAITMKEMYNLLCPAPQLRINTVSLGFPVPHPRASATTLGRLLAKENPIHQSNMNIVQPLSWTRNLPQAWYTASRSSVYTPDDSSTSSSTVGELTTEGSIGHGSGSTLQKLTEQEGLMKKQQARDSATSIPYAHTMIVRGIGTHGSHSQQGTEAYRSSLHAYGRVLDNYLSRTSCNLAGHAVFRTPTPLPLSFPAFFPPGLYDTAGAAVGNFLRKGLRPPSLHPGLSVESLYSSSHQSAHHHQRYDEFAGVSTPFSVPVMVQVSNTPSYGPNLQSIHDRFQHRDHSILHRFTRGSERTSGSSGGSGNVIELEEVQAILGNLVDDYSRD